MHLAVPTEVRVQDVWEKEEVHHDIMDGVVLGDEPLNFVINVDQMWSHEHLVSYLVQIMGKHVRQLRLTDMQGSAWHPFSR